jgi:hypothetical protein
VSGCGLNSYGSGCELMVGCCEHGNKSLVSINGNFLGLVE